MNKALLDYFYISTNGNLRSYSKDDYEFLIDGANNHIKNIKDRPLFQIILEKAIYEYMENYFLKGINDELLVTLSKNIEGINHQCLVENLNNKLTAVHIAHIPFNSPPSMFAAYMFSQITSRGGLEGLKRCKSPECRNFFIGRANVKWCSKKCGSRSRVKKMRRRNTTFKFSDEI